MKGYRLTGEQFAQLVRVSSRHHRKQIAGLVCLTAHTRKGMVSFRDREGCEVPLIDLHRKCEANAQIRRQVYNLWMNYAHFG